MKPAGQRISPGLQSMRARMTLLFALLVALLMFTAGAAVQRRERRRAERRVRDLLTLAVKRTGDEIEEAKKGQTLLKTVLDSQGEISEGGVDLLMVDARGKPLWASSHAPARWIPEDQNWRFQTVDRGRQTLVLAYPWGPQEIELSESRFNLTMLGLTVVGLTAALAWFVVGKTLSPLEALASQAREASADGFGVRLHSPSSDAEMRHLTATLNELLGRLEREAGLRGRFYAAASHELRTPIQVLLGQIDVTLSRPRSVSEHEKVLHEIQIQTVRLANLVQDLLQLNALEMRQSTPPVESTNLAYWVERGLESQRGELERRGLKVETKIEDATVEVPTSHLEILLRNLWENAIKYATPGSTVLVRTFLQECSAEIRLWNHCTLAAETEPAAWFEPFYRPDDSRNSKTGGNGLGLAISAAVARANGWELHLKKENDGVLAVVVIPRKLGAAGLPH